MKIYSMFAGIGGIDLGLESIGWTTVAFSEFDPKIAKKNGRQYAREVMAARFPDAVDAGDITTLHFEHGKIERLTEEYDVIDTEGTHGTIRKFETVLEEQIEIIAGGFPCQDISSAGKQAGIEGERSGLWRYQFAAIAGIRPKGVLIENVAALAGRGLDRVLKDLASIGYDCEWDVISAAGVGAPHLRERIFIIAWPHGEGHHGEWPTPPIFDCWLEEADAPRLVVGGQDRPAKLRCLGNAVVPQVAAHVGSLLRERITGPHPERVHEVSGQWDAKYKRGEMRGYSKCIGSALPFGPCCDGQIVPPTLPDKLPRAGRMTQGDCYERERSCTQKYAKAVALEHLAPTLRPVPGDHPELPHTGLVPTPNASVANDGEGAETWIERKLHHASKEENATRASMPLSIYAQVKLVPTPTAKDADCSRSSTAIRETPPARESQMGETLTDFVDPTNGGRLLPTPQAADGDRTTDYHTRSDGSNPTLKGAAKLLPTPTRSMQTEQDMMQAMYAGDDPERPAYADATFAKLLPTPRAADGEKNVRSLEGAQAEMERKGLSGVDLDTATRLLPTPCAADANGSRASKGADRPNEGGLLHHAKLLPMPTTQDAKNNGAPSQMDRNTLPLNAAAKLLPAPRASENENRQTKRTPSQEAGTHGLSLGAEVGSMTPEGAGRLNPTWVCGVMGFPLWWVDLP